MPVYEFKCSNCRKPFEIRLSFDEYDHAVVICPHCGSKDVARRIRRVAVAGGDKAHLESMADPMAMSAIENDPRALGKMMREMSSQVGEDSGRRIQRGSGTPGTRRIPRADRKEHAGFGFRHARGHLTLFLWYRQ